MDTRLRSLFEDISGIDMMQAEGHAAFGELGLDSLTLTQVATQIKKRFKVNLSFRQLMENYRSFDTLSAFLRESLPPEPVVAAVSAPASAAAVPLAMAAPVQAAAAQPPAAFLPGVTVPAAGGDIGSGPIVQLVAQQMELMRRQLALLSGAAIETLPVASAMPAAAASTAAVAAQPAADEPAPARSRSATTSPRPSARSRASTPNAPPSRAAGRRRGWRPSCGAMWNARKRASSSPRPTARTWPTRAWSTASGR